MAKKMSSVMLLVILLLANISLIYASSSNVIDEFGNLTDSQIEGLQGDINELKDNYDLDVVIVIVNDIDNKSMEAFADDYFDYNGFGVGKDKDGILLLLNMGDPEIWISTTGDETITKYEGYIDYMLDKLEEAYEPDKHIGLCKEFISLIENIEEGRVTKYSTKSSDRTFIENMIRMIKSPIPYIVGIVLSGIITLGLTFNSKGKVTVNNRTYESKDSFKLTRQVDTFITETVTKRKIEKSTSSGGTHTGSSGTSHGGGGRKL